MEREASLIWKNELDFRIAGLENCYTYREKGAKDYRIAFGNS